MTSGQDNERELGGDEAFAAEYVLGVLSADERRSATARIESDPAFARLVDAWEIRLAPIAAAYPEAVPPASLKSAIDGRLFGRAASASQKAGFWESLAFWRGLSAAAIAAAALLAVLPTLNRPDPVAPAPVERLVASLAGEDSDVRYLALFDASSGNVGLSHLSGQPAEGRDFELWVIQGDDPPLSLGVIPVGQAVEMPLTPEARAKVSGGAVFAISLEPAGGSSTGAPTGPVVAAGDLRDI